MRRIPLARPYFDEAEAKRVRKALASGWVSQGPAVREFEDMAARYLGVRHAVSVANCTAALHLALLSLGIKERDEVLVADYTYPATAHAVLYCRAVPVFVDIDLRTYNIDPNLIEDRITAKTKAIIPVHAFGQPAEMDGIVKIAQKHNLKIIEDAACAFGARYKNRFAGTIGDIGCFSFHGRKGITTGEGGLVVTNNRDLADKARRLSIFGIEVQHGERDGFTIPKFTELGYNYKMSDIAAAVGIAQLRKLERIIKRKESLARYLTKELSGIEFVLPPYTASNVRHIYQSYVVLIDKRIDRNRIIEKLSKGGVQAHIGTYACHIQPVYKSGCRCPNSLEIFNRALALPMYYELTYKDIDRVVRCLRQTLEELR